MQSGGDWRQRFYMPAPCDLSILAFRKWWDLAGGEAGLPWAGAPPLTSVGNGSGDNRGGGRDSPATRDNVAAAFNGMELELSGPAREQLFSRMCHIENCASCRCEGAVGVGCRDGTLTPQTLLAQRRSQHDLEARSPSGSLAMQ